MVGLYLERDRYHFKIWLGLGLERWWFARAWKSVIWNWKMVLWDMFVELMGRTHGHPHPHALCLFWSATPTVCPQHFCLYPHTYIFILCKPFSSNLFVTSLVCVQHFNCCIFFLQLQLMFCTYLYIPYCPHVYVRNLAVHTFSVHVHI